MTLRFNLKLPASASDLEKGMGVQKCILSSKSILPIKNTASPWKPSFHTLMTRMILTFGNRNQSQVCNCPTETSLRSSTFSWAGSHVATLSPWLLWYHGFSSWDDRLSQHWNLHCHSLTTIAVSGGLVKARLHRTMETAIRHLDGLYRKTLS